MSVCKQRHAGQLLYVAWNATTSVNLKDQKKKSQTERVVENCINTDLNKNTIQVFLNVLFIFFCSKQNTLTSWKIEKSRYETHDRRATKPLGPVSFGVLIIVRKNWADPLRFCPIGMRDGETNGRIH